MIMNKDILISAGVNYDEGLKRFSGNTALYEKFICKYADDNSFMLLKDAMQNKDYQAAFEYAHTLKSVTGSLSFSEMFASVKRLTDFLRAGNNYEKAREEFTETEKQYTNIINAINQAQD